MDDTNPLRERLENTIIRKTFNISGMPEAVWNEVDEFCRTFYGDSRWTMLQDLVRVQKTDYKYGMLYEEVFALKQKVAELEQKIQTKEVTPKKGPSTFGGGKE